MNSDMIIALLIFIITFYFIITEKIPRSSATIIGGASVVFFNIIDEREALHAISSNMEILILLMGLMIIVNIMAETGIFQWVAVKIAQLAKEDPIKIMIFLGVVSISGATLLILLTKKEPDKIYKNRMVYFIFFCWTIYPYKWSFRHWSN